MARTSSAVLAALLAVAPTVVLAQTAETQAPAAAATSEATQAAETATDAANTAEAAAQDASQAATDAADAATEAAEAATDAATDSPAADAAPATDAPAAEAPAADAAPAQGAEAAPAEGAVGSYYTKSTHDDWLLRCLKTADGKDPCELYQLLKDEGDKAVAEISVIPFSGEAKAILNFIAPLETDLQPGLGLQIDTAKENRYPFMVCAPIGCVSRIGLTEAELNSLKKGSKSTVSLLPFGGEGPDDLVKLNMSLKGFTAGFTALQEAMPAPAAAPAQ